MRCSQRIAVFWGHFWVNGWIRQGPGPGVLLPISILLQRRSAMGRKPRGVGARRCGHLAGKTWSHGRASRGLLAHQALQDALGLRTGTGGRWSLRPLGSLALGKLVQTFFADLGICRCQNDSAHL